MWFKNLRAYVFLRPFDPAGLAAKLETRAFAECGRLQESSAGFAEPVEGHGYVVEANQCHLFALQREAKVLPAECVRRAAQDRIDALQEQRGLKVAKRERDRIYDDARFELLPNALSTIKRTHGYMDAARGLLLVDAASDGAADAFTDTLHEALGELPIALPLTMGRPGGVMTAWLANGDAGEHWEVEHESELRLPGEGGAVVRCRNQDMWAAEIKHHLDHGKEVTRLALLYNDRVRFVLDDKLNMRRLRFLDLVHDEAEEGGESPIARAVTDLAVMSQELRGCLDWIWESFGGLDKHAMGIDQ